MRLLGTVPPSSTNQSSNNVPQSGSVAPVSERSAFDVRPIS